MFPHWILYTLLLSIVVLSILKYQREAVFTHLKASFFKSPSSIPFSKEEINFFGSTNWILLLNYFIVSTLAVYMILIYNQDTIYWLILFPVLYYAFQILSLFLTGLLSGELKRINENVLLLNFTSHFIGIAFIPILFVWMLNPNISSYMINSLIIVFVVFHILRVLRGIFLALRNNVLWYYIILYLCGSEIWPILVAYLLMSPYFIG